MLIVTHCLQIRGQLPSEDIAVGDGIVGAGLLMRLQGVFHLRGERGIDVELCQVGAYAIDHLFAQCRIEVYVDQGHSRR
jgi:hypothetical protein